MRDRNLPIRVQEIERCSVADLLAPPTMKVRRAIRPQSSPEKHNILEPVSGTRSDEISGASRAARPGRDVTRWQPSIAANTTSPARRRAES